MQFYFKPLRPSLREGDLIGYGRPVAEYGWRAMAGQPWQVRHLCRVRAGGYAPRPVRRADYFPAGTAAIRPSCPAEKAFRRAVWLWEFGR